MIAQCRDKLRQRCICINDKAQTLVKQFGSVVFTEKTSADLLEVFSDAVVIDGEVYTTHAANLKFILW